MFKFDEIRSSKDLFKPNGINLKKAVVKDVIEIKKNVFDLVYSDGEKEFININFRNSNDIYVPNNHVFKREKFNTESELESSYFYNGKQFNTHGIKPLQNLKSVEVDFNRFTKKDFVERRNFIMRYKKIRGVYYLFILENFSESLKNLQSTFRIYNCIFFKDDLMHEKYVKLLVDIFNEIHINEITKFSPNMVSLIFKAIKLKMNKEEPFETFYIPKSDGTKREINAPKPIIESDLKNLAYYLNLILEDRISKTGLDENILAYRKDKSILDNAMYHQENEIVIKYDISKFFDSCHFDYWKFNVFHIFKNNIAIMNQIDGLFENFLYRKDNKGLYMGSPLSPSASNLIMVPVMLFIKNILKNLNTDIKVSIYADDLTFSSDEINEEFNIHNLKNIVNYVFEYFNLDFKLKKEKSMVMKGIKRKVTGLSINNRNEVTIKQKKYRELRAIFHKLSNGVTFDEITGYETELSFISLINFYLYVDKSGKIERLVNKYNDVFENLKEKAVINYVE